MPQINRIRVNNVKYNFGTQFYDDFVMRFSCKNTIYDLANGGGKSVLMLLLLQTVIPNCTLDDKQPVEKLFRTNSGSTTIHSMVEWKLDSCDIKDGFRYMTCGFCARKGRADSQEESVGTDEKEVTGDESAAIDYFNYCIFYKQFGDNDIKNLPLSNGDERVTYNGLKNYLRDLEKKDLGVKVFIFEKKSDYQSFINDYGIYESQWEIVRGINKTEGHVRTYFENTYKTTRKVVEDLLVEEIIEKSYNNRIKSGPEDEQMAKTLLDIKDKLLELAKRREEIDNYDKQTTLLKDFVGKVSEFGDIYRRKEEVKDALVTCLGRAKNQLDSVSLQMEELTSKQNKFAKDILNEELLIAVSDIVLDEKSCEQSRAVADGLSNQIAALVKDRNAAKEKMDNALNANDYKEYREASSEYDKIKAYIDNKSMDSGTVGKKLRELAALKKTFVDEALKKLDSQIEEVTLAIESGKADVQSVSKKLSDITVSLNLTEAREAVAKEQLSQLFLQVSDAMKDSGLLASDTAAERLIELEGEIVKNQDKLKVTEHELSELLTKLNYCLKETVICEAKEATLYDAIKALSAKVEKNAKDNEKFDNLTKIYMETDPDRLYSTTEKICEEMINAEKEITDRIADVKKLSELIREGKLPDITELKLYQYLDERYPDKVITGVSYLETLDEDKKKACLAAVPFITGSLLVRNNYDNIIKDAVFSEIKDSNIVPVISLEIMEEAIENGDFAPVCDGVILSHMDYSFMYDEAAASLRLKMLSEEHDRLLEEYTKKHDRMLVVKNDRDFVYIYNSYRKSFEIQPEDEFKKLSDELENVLSKKDNLYSLKENLSERIEKLSSDKTALIKKADELNGELVKTSKIKELNDRIDNISSKQNEDKLKINEEAKTKKNYEEILETKNRILNEKTANRNALMAEKEKITVSWTNDFAPFFDATVLVEDAKKNYGTVSEVDAQFYAMKELMAGENRDIADKESLMNNYRRTMENLARNMEYRGINLDGDMSMLLSASLSYEEMKEVKALHDLLVRQIESKETELNGVNAQMNRIEGGIEHARRALLEKYSEIPEINIADPVNFKKEHQAKNKALKNEADGLVLEAKRMTSEYNNALIIEKDLERTVRSLDINPDTIAAAEGSYTLSAEEASKAGSEYEKLSKEEARKREDFLKHKDNLVVSLSKLEALELSEELKRSIFTPATSSDVNELCLGIEDTISCLNLEKDRIGHQIEAMESIKDSFENRCVQICQNIRNELERLPKLSKITLDDEVVPMLTLSIPYVKDSQYKERMSQYINETVSAAEHFETASEKLKFIRGRLTWKKLFSVIVTDMNSIKLNLYKRERIKDQSRYLRYEEAVGSTGQSQGIYIQFLVAIINYIASLNAGGKEASVLGKTIFIDNPFGAAKDVYIWEPIFKMLKTNHVQLIVPARGATPAITGRFDVNYVLGQKLVGTRQQTVVVDYRSQAGTDELEYTKLEYTQGTLNLEFSE